MKLTLPLSSLGARLGATSVLLATLGGLLGGCSQSNSKDSTLTVNGDVSLVYAKRVATVRLDPVASAGYAAGGDLMLREKSSASAPETNLTSRFTQGKGDVSDPEVSYDGKKVVFAMKCETGNTSTITQNGAQVKACTGRWNIWEYDMSGASALTQGTFRRITSSTTGDDVDPAYLPAGKGFVFSSNRQTKSYPNQALGHSYYALDEYERERVLNLHTMDADGGNITQISFNQSHDRNPVVRPNGDIMFSRWDHVANRNHFKIFRVKPDGTDMFVLYGAHSEGNSFLHPRDMDPSGAYAGQVITDLMPLMKTHEGGGLVLVDIANYSEQNTPANNDVPAEGGQKQITTQQLNLGRGFSRYGRVTTPYPLWDGTNRVLLAYNPCQVAKNGDVMSCAALTEAEVARLGDGTRTRDEIASDPLQADVAPAYAIYMFNPAQQTWLIVAAPPAGYIYTDPVALQARTEPNVAADTPLDETLAAQGLGLLEVRSVYDTDGLQRMGDAVLTSTDLPAGCTTAIPKIAPTDSTDTRALVADLVRMKDPADSAYRCSPARFIRVTRAVAPPSGSMGLRKAIGETSFEPQQILGYVPIQPDGSFKLLAPADTPLALAIVDEQGRAFQTHTNWIQVRPGERRTCDGCHSPRRGGSLNSGTIVNTVPAAWLASMKAKRQSGQTMATTYTTTAEGKLDMAALQVLSDLVSSDVWADTSQAGVQARNSISLKYFGNASSADDLDLGVDKAGQKITPVRADGSILINYPDHIQPLWSRSRGSGGANTCTNCHNASAKLNLSGTTTGTGRLVSYESLLIGAPKLDASGKPVITMMEGVPMLSRKPALVENAASEGEVVGIARKSRLMEILSGQTLMGSSDARSEHPTPSGSGIPDHASLLNKAEKRLLAEWMDLGAQYYNDPFDANSGVRFVNMLDEEVFAQKISPILSSTCANGCHMAVGSGAGVAFTDNRFVLTGNNDSSEPDQGDYNMALSFVWDVCQASANPLLSRPSTIPHPLGKFTQTQAVLPNDSTKFLTMLNWIASGCL